MYRIIGGDQKEYGPVTAEQLRQWVSEGRVNAQTSVLAEGAAEWKPLSAFPEFADMLAQAPSATLPRRAASLPVAAIAGRDYSLDIGDCISRSWELVKANFWPIIGVSFLVMLAMCIVNQLLGLLSGPATRAMLLERRVTLSGVLIILGVSVLSMPVYTLSMGGLFKYYLKLIRGEEARISDAFSGFSIVPGQLILVGLVSGLLSWIGYLLCILPGIYLNVAWIFSVPLMIDREMGFWEAMELSRTMVSKHWFTVFAFLLVAGLVGCCGLIACCIGIFVTATIASVAMMYAYEDIFGRQIS
jgi:hypothetical protein